MSYMEKMHEGKGVILMLADEGTITNAMSLRDREGMCGGCLVEAVLMFGLEEFDTNKEFHDKVVMYALQAHSEDMEIQ